MKYRWLIVAIMLYLLIIFLQVPHLTTLVLCLFWIGRMLFLKNRKLLVITGLLALLLLVRHVLLPDHSTIPQDSSQTGAVVKLTTVKVDGDQLRFQAYLPDFKESVAVQYTFQSQEEKENFQTKELSYILLQGTLEEPGVNRNINQFNYQKFLNRQGIFYIFKADAYKPVNTLPGKVPLSLRLDHGRFKLLSHLEGSFSGPVLTYIQALVFGRFQALDPHTVDLFKDLGIVHLMSISGLHIDLLIQLISKVLIALQVSKERRYISFVMILPVFMLLAGVGTSVFRAVTANTLRYVFLLTGINLSRSDAWSITFILALILNPLLIYSIGFQLSYGISGLLIVMGEARLLQGYSSLKQMLLINFLVNGFSIPIITYHYFEFPLISYILNLMFVPVFSSLIFPLIILCLVVGFLLPQTFLSNGFINLTNQVIILMEKGLEWLVLSENWNLVPGRLSWAMYACIGLAFFMILVWFESENKRKRLLTGALSLYCLALFSNYLSPLGQIYMFDVGQGESILIKPPFSSSVVIIDTGGRFEWSEKADWQLRSDPYSIAQDELIPTMKSLGVRKVETLFLTHGDHDHIGEVEDLVEGIKVEEIRLSRSTYHSELFQSFALENANLKSIKAGDLYTHRGIDLLALYPIDNGKLPAEDANDTSLVLYGQFGQEKWLFTGDIESGGEEALMKYYPHLSVDVLKVGHHGSRTSSGEAFIQHYRPTISLISVGDRNHYGHPHTEVTDRLMAVNSTIYRTDQDGGILYTYSDNKFLNNFTQGFKTIH